LISADEAPKNSLRNNSGKNYEARDVAPPRAGLRLCRAALANGEALGKAFWSEAEAGFDQAIRDRKRVVKVGELVKLRMQN